jgi:hypothetical protein
MVRFRRRQRRRLDARDVCRVKTIAMPPQLPYGARRTDFERELIRMKRFVVAMALSSRSGYLRSLTLLAGLRLVAVVVTSLLKERQGLS